jgi:hypothetical protein
MSYYPRQPFDPGFAGATTERPVAGWEAYTTRIH